MFPALFLIILFMSATNTPVGTPVETQENTGLLSQIQEGVKSIQTKARNLAGSAMVGATALTGTLATPAAVGVTTAALSENAEAATIIPVT
jgi:hypothetical protein